MYFIKTSLFLIMLFLPASLVAQESYVLIINSSNNETSITESDLSKVFLKRQSQFSNGIKATPVDQAPEASVRSVFSEKILKRSVSAMKNFWSQQLFSGAAVPPEELPSDVAVINFVSSNPGGIGYISADTDISSSGNVKVLTVE